MYSCTRPFYLWPLLPRLEIGREHFTHCSRVNSNCLYPHHRIHPTLPLSTLPVKTGLCRQSRLTCRGPMNHVRAYYHVIMFLYHHVVRYSCVSSFTRKVVTNYFVYTFYFIVNIKWSESDTIALVELYERYSWKVSGIFLIKITKISKSKELKMLHQNT